MTYDVTFSIGKRGIKWIRGALIGSGSSVKCTSEWTP